jgi:serine/threonine protein kinase
MAIATGERNQVKEMIREENILSLIDSPYIIRYHDSFLNNEELYIVTEYCEVYKIYTIFVYLQ